MVGISSENCQSWGAWVAGQTAEGERIPTRLHAERRARGGARTHDPETMTRAEVKSQTLD